MRLIEDYLQLRQAFPQAAVHQPFQVSMRQLAETLYCSQRNAKFILVKMCEQEWIVFHPGRGRGHMSELTFLAASDELILLEAQERVRQGEVEQALSFIQERAKGTNVQKRFLDWFSLYFGYQEDHSQDRTFERLTLPVYRPVVTLDPSAAFYALDCHLISQIFNTLVEYEDETGAFAGGIAHHWERNHDATEWTFYIRKGIRFHHGRELDARDVIYTIQRLQNSPQRWVVRQIKEMAAISKFVVRLRLGQPNYFLLRYLSYVPSSIVPADVYEPLNGGEPALPVGTGPFKLAKWNKGGCLLEAFDAYYHVRPHLDEVEIVVIPEMPDDFFLQMKDRLLDVQTGEADREEENRNGWEISERVSGTNVLTVNLTKSGILQNPDFRKAIVHLIDRNRMVETLGKPRINPSNGFYWDRDAPSSNREYCPDIGAKWLEQSGYKGEPIRLHTYERHAPDAFWLQEQFHKYGIHVIAEILTWGDMMDPKRIREADLVLFEAITSEGDIRLLECYESENSFVRMHLPDPLAAFIDETVGKYIRSANEKEQDECMQAIENKLKEENALIFLAYKSVSSAAHPSLFNAKLHPRGWVDFKQLWLHESDSSHLVRS